MLMLLNLLVAGGRAACSTWHAAGMQFAGGSAEDPRRAWQSPWVD